MKKVLVVCGAGVATSTILNHKIDELLSSNNIEHQLIQCSINEIDAYVDSADLIVSSMVLAKDYSIPKLNGIAYLTGMNEDKLNEDILEKLK